MSTEHVNRRQFLGTAAGVAGAAMLAGSGIAADDKAGQGKSIALVVDPADAVASAQPAQWALGKLRDALTSRGFETNVRSKLDETPLGEFWILIGGATAPLVSAYLATSQTTMPAGPESLAIVATKTQHDQPVLLAAGNDTRGLGYALLELAERVTYAEQPQAALTPAKPTIERPANVVRSVARLFTSDVEDKSWYNDKAFWRSYLTMLATQRFNRFNLTLGLGYDFTRQIEDCYFHFAYPFLLDVPGYKVRAVGLKDAERDSNLEMLRFISEETVARGMAFQLGVWTHAYRWTQSPRANFTIDGLNDGNHANYCRDALAAVLKACPAISGVTIRIHGESGVPEGSYEFWESVFNGTVKSGRKVDIDLHAKGIDQKMIDTALKTGMNVNVSPKYWAEHMGLPYHQASIRELEIPPPNARDQGFFAQSDGSRKFMRYGYGDLFAEDRKYSVTFRMWPGTQRVLLWGDPEMAAAYGRASSFCGALGMEWCEPLSFKGRKGSGKPGGRLAYADATLNTEFDWQKYEYSYRLWGRTLYNPDTEPETWRRYLRKEWGAAAEPLENALASASRILPLVTTAHMPSAANNNYWPEIYTNMSISDPTVPNPYSDSPTPRRFGTVSPIDPSVFSTCDQFAEELWTDAAGRRGEGLAQGPRYSPGEVAQCLDTLAETATTRMTEAWKKADLLKDPRWRRIINDVALQCGLGRFFAYKFRAGALYALFERSKDRNALAEAVKQYRAAREEWSILANRAESVYARDITYGMDRHSRGHWLDRLPAIEQDVQRLATLLEQTPIPPRPMGPVSDMSAIVGVNDFNTRRIQAVLVPSQRRPPAIRHQPPKSFRPGEPITIELSAEKLSEKMDPQRGRAIRLHYRHVNQAETYQLEWMKHQDDLFTATIPAAYTKSPYPLQYFFAMHYIFHSDYNWLYPGFEPNLCNQPYFVIRSA